MKAIKNEVKGIFSFITKKCYQLLPGSLRGYILRNRLRINHNLPEQIEFEVAQSKEDLKAAYRLVHDAYVREGYLDPQPSGMKMCLQNALPSTTTVVAKYKGRVVGTLTAIRENPFGLPMEKVFQTSKLRTGKERLVEISALAVDKTFFRRKGDLSLPLMKLTFNYCLNYFGSDIIVISVNPKAYDFYKSILEFTPLDKKVTSHGDYVKGAPAVGFYFNLKTMKKTWEKRYKSSPKEKNIYNYMWTQKYDQIHLPERKYHKIADPLFSPEDLDYFFNKNSSAFQKTTDFERYILRSIYNHHTYKSVIPKPSSAFVNFYERDEIRFDTRTTGKILSQVNDNPFESNKIQILNVSRSGIQIDGMPKLKIGQSIGLSVLISLNTFSRITAEVRFCDDCIYGLRIIKSDYNWSKYINYLERDQIKYAWDVDHKVSIENKERRIV